mmetsp:Transcript_49101/g.138108  ORF Transcript_49101/g.138108 Transcript_49101/m.138108 type:complete len:241 (+) Transcript_49101:515-1237(+)
MTVNCSKFLSSCETFRLTCRSSRGSRRRSKPSASSASRVSGCGELPGPRPPPGKLAEAGTLPRPLAVVRGLTVILPEPAEPADGGTASMEWPVPRCAAAPGATPRPPAVLLEAPVPPSGETMESSSAWWTLLMFKASFSCLSRCTSLLSLATFSLLSYSVCSCTSRASESEFVKRSFSMPIWRKSSSRSRLDSIICSSLSSNCSRQSFNSSMSSAMSSRDCSVITPAKMLLVFSGTGMPF